MGCDIRCIGEIKIGGNWYTYNQGDFHRNYIVFGYMSTIDRANVEPIVAPKGLPEDLSVVARFAYKQQEHEFHSASWFNPHEIKQLEQQCRKLAGNQMVQEEYLLRSMGELFGNSWENFIQFREDYPPEIEAVRWVFWFIG